DGKTAPSNRIGIGQIGLGRQAVHANMSVFMRSGYCQTVALCDVDRWRLNVEGNPSLASVAKRNQWDPNLLNDTFRTTDFRELLAHPRVDAVMINTPDHWHVPIALAAIKAGKDIACEKPIGLAIAHGRVLADAAAKSDIVFRTDSNFRSEPELFRAVSLVRTGKIGAIKRIRMSVPIYPVPEPVITPMPVPEELDYEMWQGPIGRQPYTEDRVHPRQKLGRPGWYSNRLYCDGMITNWGYHPADIVQWANDTEHTGPVEVEGRAELPPADQLYNVHGEFEVRYRYANGVELEFVGRRDYREGESYMHFEGTEGWVRGWRAPNRIEAEPRSILDAEVKFEEFPFLLRNEKTDFIECIRTRSRTLEDAEVGHRSSTVPQLGYIACLLGRKLAWDPVKEEFPGDAEANQLAQVYSDNYYYRLATIRIPG
ncbi:MAG: Gfo/Idh/MocA family oxidoreductase, partial [Patescibacteria group bacterium]|nr:Gfo/Idh/MocA family oxidoreductase [Patescibacteria group bacterium]